jgi:hypothetical protein
MHVSTKETDENGVHIFTNTAEGDGPVALASPDAKLSAEVIAVRRTASGGVFVQTALHIEEPVKAAPQLAKSADEQAKDYLASKSYSGDSAEQMLKKYGAAKILEFKAKDEAAAREASDAELAAALGLGKKEEPKAAETPKPPTLQ